MKEVQEIFCQKAEELISRMESLQGLGMAVGFTLLGALVIYLLQRLVLLKLPLISDFIAQLVRLVLEKF